LNCSTGAPSGWSGKKTGSNNKTGSSLCATGLSRASCIAVLLQNLFACYRAQVMVELQLIQVTKSDMLNYGISLPNAFNIAFTGSGLSSVVSAVLPAGTANPFPTTPRLHSHLWQAMAAVESCRICCAAKISTSLRFSHSIGIRKRPR